MTGGVYSILGFVAQLKAIEHDMNALGPAIVAKACEMVCEEHAIPISSIGPATATAQ
jgi:hypothetical protein